MSDEGARLGTNTVHPGAMTALLKAIAAAPNQPEAPELQPLPRGALVSRFEIQRELGRGAFGVVYEARDRDLGRSVALKVVRPEKAAAGDQLTREAEAVARLSHPNLVHLYEVGHGDQGPYLVFEYLRGRTLQVRIDEGPIPVSEAVRLAVEVARGLAYAHAEGVVHRDLKPSNVFVTDKGAVKLLDFGMAHAFGRKRVSGGTPAYMAPEQWHDDPEDERTDVFAMGVVLHRMLSGEYPFPEQGGKWSSGEGHAPRLAIDVAPELGDLVRRMLEQAPRNRPRDGSEVLAALEKIEAKLRALPEGRAETVQIAKGRLGFGDLVAELKRRRVFRVLVGYGIFCFAVLQVIEPVMHALHLGEWVLTAVIAALAVGFPVALVLAWVFDLTAQGVRRTPSATGRGGASFSRGRIAAALMVLGLVAALPGISWYAWQRWREQAREAAAGVQTASIAVLPFDDLSPGHDQDYLSEGLAEEISTALSRVKGLRVPGRASSFWLKRKNADPAEIGEKLNVAHLLEGSVRRSGNRLRIKAEVVRIAGGERVWGETFERDLTDVFAIQDEIASAVVEALRVKLLPGTMLPTQRHRTTSTEAYEQFLLGRQLNTTFTRDSLQRARVAFERALSLDPSYSLARAWLAYPLGNLALLDGTASPGNRRLAESALAEAKRSVEQAPDLADGYAARGWLRAWVNWEWQAAEDDLRKALALDPRNATTLVDQATIAASLGRLDDAVRLSRSALEIEPLWTIPWFSLGRYYLGLGQTQEARKALLRALEITPTSGAARYYLAVADLLDGRLEEALAGFEADEREWVRLLGRAVVAHARGHSAESNRALELLGLRSPRDGAYPAAIAYSWCGQLEKAYAWLWRAVAAHEIGLRYAAYDPLLAKVRADPRFASVMRAMNVPGPPP